MTNAQKFIEEKLLPELEVMLHQPTLISEYTTGYNACLRYFIEFLEFRKSEWQSPVSVGEIERIGKSAYMIPADVTDKINELVDGYNKLLRSKKC